MGPCLFVPGHDHPYAVSSAMQLIEDAYNRAAGIGEYGVHTLAEQAFDQYSRTIHQFLLEYVSNTKTPFPVVPAFAHANATR
jgi:hypothetical protein